MGTFSIFLVLIILVAFLLVIVIMVQNPKGGGLSSSFGGGASQQLGGVKQTTDFLDKSTWYLALFLIVLISILGASLPFLEGADVVFVPSRWGKPRKTHMEVLARALAVMNQCYVVVSNSSDEDMASSSSIISPTGEVTMNDKLEAIEGNIDFREIKKMRRYIVMD